VKDTGPPGRQDSPAHTLAGIALGAWARLSLILGTQGPARCRRSCNGSRGRTGHGICHGGPCGRLRGEHRRPHCPGGGGSDAAAFQDRRRRNSSVCALQRRPACVLVRDGCKCVSPRRLHLCATNIGHSCRHHAAAAGSAVALACLGSIDVSLLLETDAEGWCVYSASPSLRIFWRCLREIRVCLCVSACSITLTLQLSRNPAHTAAFYGHLSALEVKMKMPLAAAKNCTNVRDFRAILKL
jgi:hypothetical protein